MVADLRTGSGTHPTTTSPPRRIDRTGDGHASPTSALVASGTGSRELHRRTPQLRSGVSRPLRAWQRHRFRLYEPTAAPQEPDPGGVGAPDPQAPLFDRASRDNLRRPGHRTTWATEGGDNGPFTTHRPGEFGLPSEPLQ
ncbi:MAG: hypothetical protein R2716_00365 [Microthrixaceae bacterium]